MDQKPFVSLNRFRPIDRPDLPDDLVQFYKWHEGVGLESSPDRAVRLCKLVEVAQVGWQDVESVAEVPEGWADFAAFRVGSGMFFEKIVYVCYAPSCHRGSLLAIGRDVCGPGGDGPYALESSLVLAASFSSWLAHLAQWRWIEPAVSGIRELTKWEQGKILDYYLSLNPGMNPG